MNSEKLEMIKKIVEVKKKLEFCRTSEIDLLGEALTVINFIEKENEGLQEENYKLYQNLKQCENGYNLELHTARYQLCTVEDDLQRAKDKIDCLHKSLCTLRKQSRKETAKEILQKLQKHLCYNEYIGSRGYFITLKECEELAKQYGVGIGEEL